MKLKGQRKAIYEYLKTHGEATIIQMRNDLKIAKPDMRISELNHAHQEEHGEDLIVTVRKLKNGEHVKAIKKPLTKTVSRFAPYTDENGDVVMREIREEVAV